MKMHLLMMGRVIMNVLDVQTLRLVTTMKLQLLIVENVNTQIQYTDVIANQLLL